MKILRNSTYKEMETKIRDFKTLTDSLASTKNRLLIENSRLTREIREYKVKDFIVEVKKNRKNVSKDKFISEYLIGSNQKTLVNHIRDTRTKEEFVDIFGNYIVFTEVPVEDRFEILLKDMSERKEFLEEQGWTEENEEENQ